MRRIEVHIFGVALLLAIIHFFWWIWSWESEAPMLAYSKDWSHWRITTSKVAPWKHTQQLREFYYISNQWRDYVWNADWYLVTETIVSSVLWSSYGIQRTCFPDFPVWVTEGIYHRKFVRNVGSTHEEHCSTDSNQHRQYQQMGEEWSETNYRNLSSDLKFWTF